MSTEPISKEQRAFARCLKEARVGDPAAQYQVALMYANGVGVGKNVDQAMTWTESAAKKGHVAAQYLLGIAYQGGLGVQRNTQLALTWLLKAAESGSDKAPLKLARLLKADTSSIVAEFTELAAKRGISEAQLEIAQAMGGYFDPALRDAAALEWCQKAAESGVAEAQALLARWLEQSQGNADRELQKALHWYRQAARQGHPGAQLALARLDGEGWGRAGSDRLARLEGKTATRRGVAKERRLLDARFDTFAESAEAVEQYHLGLMYRDGKGVPASEASALSWFERAADHGLVDAQWALAELLFATAPAEALAWCLKAAEQGHADAQWKAACCFREGIGTPVDFKQTLGLYAEAALAGCREAQYDLSDFLGHQSEEVAQVWLAEAARGGVAQAQYAWGQRHASGSGVPQDWVKAADWFARAAAQGHADAQCAYASCLADGLGVKKDIVRAMEVYEAAAQQDHPRALWSLGELLADGRKGLPADARRAALCCKRAAHAGFAPAQSTLAALFAKAGKYDQAVHWWTLASRQDDPEALYNLAHAFRVGWTTGDEDASVLLLQRAADLGLTAAQARLGLCYAMGEGAPLDPIEGAKWFILAARAGDTAAQANRQRAEATLTPAQWREATRRAELQHNVR